MSRLTHSMLVLAALATCTQDGLTQDGGGELQEEAREVLLDLHRAAAEGDRERYWGHFAPEAVILGTAAEERFDLPAFREWSIPFLTAGRQKAASPVDLNVTVSSDGTAAWFDESLQKPTLAEMRASGVMLRKEGRWRIVQLNHVFPVPNELANEFAEMVANLSSRGSKPVEDSAESQSEAKAVEAASAVLTQYYVSGAEADFEGYFSHFAADAVLLGTAPLERFSIPTLKVLVKPRFDQGQGRPTQILERHVYASEDGRWAWFDERLKRNSLAPMRSSGLMRRDGDRWEIVQYHMAFSVPNELAAELSNKIQGLPGSRAVKEPLSPEEVREDFAFLRENLETMHPALYVYETEEEVQRFFDAAADSITTPMTLLELEKLMTPVLAKAHCVHTRLLPSPALQVAYQELCSLIPLDLRWVEGGLYVLRDLRSTGTTMDPGTEIRRIDGRPAAEVVEQLFATIPSDGHNRTQCVRALNQGFALLYSARIDNPERFTVAFLAPGSGEEQIAELTGMGYSDWQWSRDQGCSEATAPTLSSEFLPEEDLAILKIKSFSIDPRQHHLVFFDNFFCQLADTEISHLILDLRGNRGGEPEFGARLLSYLADKKFIYLHFDREAMTPKIALSLGRFVIPRSPAKNRFPGEVFLLVDGNCTSTTGHFCSLVKFHDWGTFVGEETGATFTCNDNSETITLPNSGLSVNIARSTFETEVSGMPRGRGITPVHEVVPTLQDLLDSRDAVMEYVRQLIRERPGR